MESHSQSERSYIASVESDLVQTQAEVINTKTAISPEKPVAKLPERPTSSLESVLEPLVSPPENQPSQLQEEDPKEIILDAVSDIQKTGYQEQDLVSLAQTLQRQHDPK